MALDTEDTEVHLHLKENDHSVEDQNVLTVKIQFKREMKQSFI